VKVTQGAFSFLPELTDEQIRLQVLCAIRNGWSVSVEYTDDPHPRNSLWEMWRPPHFELPESDVQVFLDEIAEARRELPRAYVKVVAYDRALGRQTTALAFIVGRPAYEPGFRLERQERSDRSIRYTIHSYATDAPAGERYRSEPTP
jgi:ribulose-bisphosphate carboxylase small chain